MYTNEREKSTNLAFYAGHGAALFPIPRGRKSPVGIVASFKTDWSKDPAQWERWRAEHGCNFGVVAFASNWIILDTDIKPVEGQSKEDARNEAWTMRCELFASWGLDPATHPPHCTSAHGGWHDYLVLPAGVDAATLRQPDAIKGRINVRVIGYVVGAGSHYDGQEKGDAPGYYTLTSDVPPHPAPAALVEHCSPAKSRESVATASGYDQGDMVKMLEYLTEHDEFDSYESWVSAGMSIKTEFGDAGLPLWAITHNASVTPDVIATKWKSFASEPKPGGVTVQSLMQRAHQIGWKGRINEAKMFGNAAQWAAAAGAPGMPALPVVDTTDAPTQPFPTPQIQVDEFPAPPGGFMRHLGSWLDSFVLPEYLWDGILIKRFCYSLTAQTGTGKTAFALLLAVYVALGKSLSGRDVVKGLVVYFAGENPTDVQMRFLGLCHEMGLDPHTLDVLIIEGVVPLSKVAGQIVAECEEKHLRPALVIVDTAAAYFEGDDDNGNVQMGAYARQLRSLCTIPGEPCVLVLAHPTKGAQAIEEMTPRGGGAFINEMDGNVGAAKVDGLIRIQKIGKFRGPDFAPLHFGTHAVDDVPQLYDKKRGKFLPTVVAAPVTEAGAAARAMEGETADIRLLQDIYDHPRDDLRKRAPRIGCHHVTVGRRISALAKRKLVDDTGLHIRLTPKGQKELNALDDVQQGATEMVPFPVPKQP